MHWSRNHCTKAPEGTLKGVCGYKDTISSHHCLLVTEKRVTSGGLRAKEAEVQKDSQRAKEL